MPSLAELYLERGRQASNAARESGDRSAALWSGLGNTVANTVGQIAQYQADAPKRELAGLELDAARSQKASAEAAAKSEARLRALFASNESPDPKAIMEAAGPERGTKIIEGIAALQDVNMKRFKTQQDIVAATLGGMDALPESVRAELYPHVRQTLLQRGVIKADDAPEAYDAGWFQQARGFGQERPKPQESKVVGEGGNLVGPDGKVLFTAPTKPTPLTFGAPTPSMVDGKRVFFRTGSDGKTYDMTGNVVTKIPTPIAPEGPQPSFTRAEIVMPDGTIKTANYNSRTGKYTDVDSGATLQGVGRAPTDKDISATEGKKKLGTIVSALSGLSEKINTSSGVIATLRGKEEKAKAQINLNDDVAEYQSIIESFTPIIARALGHTGVLTQQDVDSAKAMFPKPEDSKSLRDRKVKRLNELLGLEPTATKGGDAPPAGWVIK